MKVKVMSFGWKHGDPPKANWTFDVRRLPNPYGIARLRYTDGTQPEVADWLFRAQRTQEFADTIRGVVEQGLDSRRTNQIVAFGCVGGFHRSVAMAEECARYLAEEGWDVELVHRDIKIGRVHGHAD